MSAAHEVKDHKDLWDNPLGLNGFEFVEYTAEDPALLGPLFEQLGFVKIAVHRSKKVELWRQNDVNFIVNLDPNTRAKRFAKEHKAGANAMAFRVADARRVVVPQVRAHFHGKVPAGGPHCEHEGKAGPLLPDAGQVQALGEALGQGAGGISDDHAGGGAAGGLDRGPRRALHDLEVGGIRRGSGQRSLRLPAPRRG